MKLKYETPELDVIILKNADILTNSPTGDDPIISEEDEF